MQTPAEHLERIKAKCRANLALAEDLLQSIAGWRSTIATCDWLIDDMQAAEDDGDTDCVRALERRAQVILAAWPEELL